MTGSDGLPSMSIVEVLARWPQTAGVFRHYNLACVGCAVASFCLVADAASVYGLPLAALVADLLVAIERLESPG